MASLKTERYMIQPVVASGHSAMSGDPVKCQCEVTSNGSDMACPADLTLSAGLAADLLAEMKAKAAAAVPAGATLDTTKEIEGEYWMNDAHDGIEAEAFVYFWVTYPADGPVAAREEKIGSAAFDSAHKATLQTEAASAVSSMMA